MGTRVYVGGLSYRARERDVERFFRRYGKIRDISLKNGFAFVEFDDYHDADDACYELSGKELMGERVTIEMAKGTPHGRDRDRWGTGGGGRRGGSPGRRGDRDRGRRDSRDGGRNRPGWMDKYGPPTRTDYRLIVENLSSRVSWQDLKDYMRQAGDVTYADAHKSRKNEGNVEFGNYDDLKTALDKLDGTELNGRKIKLIEPSSSRRSKRSRSRSDSRSRSRSRSRSARRSRSRSPKRSRSRSRSGDRRDKSRSRSAGTKSRSRSRTPSRPRDAEKANGDDERGRSRSRSAQSDRSVEKNGKGNDDSRDEQEMEEERRRSSEREEDRDD